MIEKNEQAKDDLKEDNGKETTLDKNIPSGSKTDSHEGTGDEGKGIEMGEAEKKDDGLQNLKEIIDDTRTTTSDAQSNEEQQPKEIDLNKETIVDKSNNE